VSDAPFFHVPLNLPHAGRVARRILTLLHRDGRTGTRAGELAAEIVELLDACFEADENPPPTEATRLRERAAALGRQLVDAIELDALGHDRLGQCVRNFFECLELGREGAALSLRAGESPDSMQRPR
jgi:hypothetical protein